MLKLVTLNNFFLHIYIFLRYIIRYVINVIMRELLFSHTFADRIIENLTLKEKEEKISFSARRGSGGVSLILTPCEADIFGVKASGYYVPIRDALSRENRISHGAEHNSYVPVHACERFN